MEVTLTAMCFMCGGTVEVGTFPEQEALARKEKLEHSERVYLFKCLPCLEKMWGPHWPAARAAGFAHV